MSLSASASGSPFHNHSLSNGSHRLQERKPSNSSLTQLPPHSYYNQRKMTNTVRASNKAAILAVGEELRMLLHEEDPPIIKDRRYHLKAYQDCFVGHDMVDWLLKKGEVESRKEAVAMMQKLLENGVVHHVCDDHMFKDDKLFYRFRKDDGSYHEPPDSAIIAKGQRLYSRVRGDSSGLIQDRRYHLSTYKQCFIAKDFVDWLIQKGEASTRQEATVIGCQLVDAEVIHHVCDDHHFKDEFLFFRFNNDERGKSAKLKDRIGLKKNSSRKKKDKEGQEGDDDSSSTSDPSERRTSGGSWESSSENTPPLRETPEVEEYIHMQPHSGSLPPSVPVPHPQSNSPRYSPSLPRVPVPQPSTDIKSNGSVSGGVPRRPTIEELTDPNGRYTKRSVDVVSDPVGYGFVIRGSKPVYVHTIDPSGPAAAAGLKVGEYLFSVNGHNVLHASHTDAARIILMGASVASLVTFTEKYRLKS